jgi:hypothetical protein
MLLNKQQLNYNIEDRCFIRGPCRGVTSGTLRVVGGDEKGSLESETAKYGHES